MWAASCHVFALPSSMQAGVCVMNECARAGPLMLEMGVLPDVAAATSATMILFTSAAAAVVFLSFGGVPPAYAGLAFAVGLLSTAAGQARMHPAAG